MKNNKIFFHNALSEDHFKNIKNVFLSEYLPWNFTAGIVYGGVTGKKDFQFTLDIWSAMGVGNLQLPGNYTFNAILPILQILEPAVLFRIKANLRPKAHKLEESDWHCDNDVPKASTAIYYIDTNDGYTKWKDGDKLRSKENTLVVFPNHLEHLGTPCTNANRRTFINFNFFSYKTFK